MAREKLSFRNRPRARCRIMPCTSAADASQGTSEAFSTGSHPQYPPQPSVTYAQ